MTERYDYPDEPDLKMDEQMLSCPADCYKKYKDRMIQHKVPFREILFDDEKAFILPRRYRPLTWKL